MALADLNKSPRCQHVHYSGKPCKAPARRGRNYCVFHQAAHLDPGGCVLPIIEDVHSYQLAIIRIARALADDIIDSRKATALLYALQLAGSKLDAFAKLRSQVEDPVASLKNEIAERYDAIRHPFPSYIPEKELLAILRDVLKEKPAEPADTESSIPGPFLARDVWENADPAVPAGPPENSPALQRRVAEENDVQSAGGTTETPTADPSVPAGLDDDDAERLFGVETPGLHGVSPGRPAPPAGPHGSHAAGAA